jgi:light-regulated signal transduction histidine kinase (bacteriophytochrome)
MAINNGLKPIRLGIGKMLTLPHSILQRFRVHDRRKEVGPETRDALQTSNASLRVEIADSKLERDQIRLTNDDLERRVAERTAELTNALKELDAFTYSVAHDLRAPLRHIDGFIDLLHKRIVFQCDDESRRYMYVIADAAKGMGVLIDNLLAFSKMSRMEIKKEPVRLNELVDEIRRELEGDMVNRQIQWSVGELPVVSADPLTLRLAMTNLIHNALKFTRTRETAKIEVGSREEASGETTVFVRDNGVGFDMKYVDKLFGVFQRLHRTEEFEGTGIGLANVRRHIHRMGGRTWAEGVVDGGATFYFTLPKS